MNPRIHLRLRLIGLDFMAAACSSRAVPRSFPAASPAASSGAAAPEASLTRALDEEPPLPGENDQGWPGLRAPGLPPTVVALEVEFDALLESDDGLAIDVRSVAREAQLEPDGPSHAPSRSCPLSRRDGASRHRP